MRIDLRGIPASILLGTCLFFLPKIALASNVDGVIDATNFTSSLLDNATGLFSTTTPNNLYWNTPAPYAVHVLDAELRGYLWGDALGWISLNCSNTASCASEDFKVINDGEGNLSGYAWGEHAGWMSFSCANLETNNCVSNNDARVTIAPDGTFFGHAWTENFGWVKFDCALGTSSCVQTDWRPVSSRLGVVAGTSTVSISAASVSALGGQSSEERNEEMERPPTITESSAASPGAEQFGSGQALTSAGNFLGFPSLGQFPKGEIIQPSLLETSSTAKNLFDISAEPAQTPEQSASSKSYLLFPLVLVAAIPLGIIGRAVIMRFYHS